MEALKKPVAYLCAVVLIWTGVAAGLVPPVSAAPLGAMSSASAFHGPAGHHADTHDVASPHGAAHHSGFVHQVAMTSYHQSVVCITSCLESLEAKLLPKTTGTDSRSEPVIMPINWPREALRNPAHQQVRLAYWPTGPPGGPFTGGTGAERVLALNTRLRN